VCMTAVDMISRRGFVKIGAASPLAMGLAFAGFGCSASSGPSGTKAAPRRSGHARNVIFMVSDGMSMGDADGGRSVPLLAGRPALPLDQPLHAERSTGLPGDDGHEHAQQHGDKLVGDFGGVGTLDLEPGMKIGMNVVTSDNDRGGGRQRRLSWVNPR
jgi:hypothetical protein